MTRVSIPGLSSLLSRCSLQNGDHAIQPPLPLGPVLQTRSGNARRRRPRSDPTRVSHLRSHRARPTISHRRSLPRGGTLITLSCARITATTLLTYPQAGLTPTDLHTQFIAFLSEAHRLKTKYASQITLLVGAESEYITSADLVGLDSLLNVHGDRIEYLVGSVHHVGGIPIDFDLPTFDRAIDSFSGVPSGPSTSLFTTHVNSSDPDASSTAADNTKTTAFLNAYLDAQYTLLTRFHPEIIGHFDLCRLYTPYLLLSSYPYSLERVRRNVEYAVSYGALFELNAAAFRKGWDAAYPGEDIVDVRLRPFPRSSFAITYLFAHSLAANGKSTNTYRSSKQPADDSPCQMIVMDLMPSD